MRAHVELWPLEEATLCLLVVKDHVSNRCWYHEHTEWTDKPGVPARLGRLCVNVNRAIQYRGMGAEHFTVSPYWSDAAILDPETEQQLAYARECRAEEEAERRAEAGMRFGPGVRYE